MNPIKTLNNLFGLYGMYFAATQQELRDLSRKPEHTFGENQTEKELKEAEIYYRGVLDTLEVVLTLLEKETNGKRNNQKYL